MGSWPEYPEIDREHVEKAFTKYAEGYDLSDVKNKLKYDHTFRVAAMCDAISESLPLEKPRKDLAWLTGMLHDIGRFEQVRRYHTFRDGDSVNHAQLSADILFHDDLIRRFVSNPSKDALVEKTIRLHNVYILPDSLTEEEYRCGQDRHHARQRRDTHGGDLRPAHGGVPECPDLGFCARGYPRRAECGPS